MTVPGFIKAEGEMGTTRPFTKIFYHDREENIKYCYLSGMVYQDKPTLK